MKSIETDAVKRNKGFFILLLFFFALFLSASDGYSFTITANAGAGGYISPSGDVPVAAGADQTFTIMPDLGYEIFDVATDSGSVGLVSSYTFIDVAADDSITASFSACTNTETVKLQSNGFFYNTIIGAYFAANPGSDTIMLKAGTLPDEILFFDQDVSVVIDGGNNCDFTDNYMMTRIPGSLTVAAGTVTLSNIILSEPLFCQEGDPNYPPSPEICDCIDNNCNGLVDDGLTIDVDGDGYSATGSCSGSGDDCNDNNASIHPFGEILGDGIDQDCNGVDVLPGTPENPASPVATRCSSCHSWNMVNNLVHDKTGAPDGTCVDCHAPQVNAMLPGHYGLIVKTTGNGISAGSVISCTTCHLPWNTSTQSHSGSNAVWAKVAPLWNGSTYVGLTCNTCHGSPAHTTGTAHNNRSIDSSCAQCHSPLTTQADVDTLHRNDCALCHAYDGTKICVQTVEQAIEDGMGMNGTPITCTDCHSAHHSPETNQVSYDPAVDTSQSLQQGCADCHHDYDTVNGTSLGLSTWETILVEHDLDGIKDGSSSACGSCHAYGGDENSSPPGPAVQTAIAAIGNPATCATCHTDKVPAVVHGTPTSGKHPTHLAMAGVTGCSFCHTNPPYFQSGTDTNEDGLYVLAETDVCNPCHQDWDPAGLPVERDYKDGWSEAGFTLECTYCHAEIVDNGDAVPVGGRRAVADEFPTSAHAHYGAVLDSASCQVCHDHASHADGAVNLLDPDGGTGYDFIYVTDITSDPDLSNFCANCHDDNGATRLTLPLDPLDPFGNGNAPPDIASRFMGTLQWYEWYGDFCFGSEGSNRPVNSHHDISDADQAFSGAKIECLNCHGSHTSAQSQKVTNPFASNVAWAGTLNEFCLACHAGGHGPNDPTFPANVGVPAFYTPPPANIPGESCGTDMVYDCAGTCVAQADVDTALANGSCDDSATPNLDCNIFDFDNRGCSPVNPPNTSCGTDMVYDCADNCVAQATVNAAFSNTTCDEAAGLDLNCSEFNYDLYDCDSCIGNDCSYIGGIDSCNYYLAPWWIQVTWTNEAHGGDSKRDWGGYSGAPAATMDCVACHDSHGSYDAVANPDGNPYMFRDYVDGTQFIDDGYRPGANWTGPPWDTTGTAGSVVIKEFDGTSIGPKLGDQLCVKCHAGWLASYSWHSSCGGCLTCHSHGMAWGAQDLGSQGGDDAQWCP